MGRMWKQYGKDVETICEGCGNNMIWKQYDQNFILPYHLKRKSDGRLNNMTHV